MLSSFAPEGRTEARILISYPWIFLVPQSLCHCQLKCSEMCCIPSVLETIRQPLSTDFPCCLFLSSKSIAWHSPGYDLHTQISFGNPVVVHNITFGLNGEDVLCSIPYLFWKFISLSNVPLISFYDDPLASSVCEWSENALFNTYFMIWAYFGTADSTTVVFL